ncbi:MAG: hypothetical protein IJW53_02585 [Clostridia bacterium]|nr:hypothetical protein [Clostridia bacterium]
MKLTEKSKKRIHLGFGILMSAMLVLVGILFITSCYSIYKSGQSPFTRESIARAFSKIAVWVYITVSLVIVGVGVSIALPTEGEKLKGARSLTVLVKKLSERVDLSGADGQTAEKIVKERKLRSILGYVRLTLITLSAVLPLIFLLNPANFPAVSGEYNAEILHGMLVYLAFLAPLFVYEVVYVILRDLSLKREHALLKEALASSGICETRESSHSCVICKAADYLKKNEKPIVLGVRIALVGCAVAFIVMGITNGGMADVLNKAIKICTECIGLG